MQLQKVWYICQMKKTINEEIKIKNKNNKAFMIFLDIDGLKSVNDNQGHEVGDAFIVELADV